MKLLDRVAVITGTSPNIGGGIVEALASEGANIVAIDTIAENADDCAAYIEAIGGRALPITCDVTDEEQVTQSVDKILETFGKIDILVNNAAFYNKKGVIDMPYDEWLAQTGVILGGAFLLTKYVARSIIERQGGGTIINIISTAGHQGEPGNVAYSTAKSGLLNFTRSTAMELADHGIRVNSLTPTATDRGESFDRAERWGRSIERPENDVMESYRERSPMQKLPRPSDYGRAVVFLASDDARMITGTDLRVDAGAIAKYWPWEPGKKVSL